MLQRSTGIVLDVKWDPVTKTFRDFSRNHHTITNHNVTPVRGRSGVAGYFNGDNAYLDCGNDPSLDITDAITIEAWVKPDTLSQDSIVVCQDVPSSSGKIAIGIYTTENKILLGVTYNPVGLFGISSYLTAGQWQHWVEVYDITNDTIKFYLDGKEQTLIDVYERFYTNGGTLRIGARETERYFNGAIDEVRIYNRALSADEIKTHYQPE